MKSISILILYSIFFINSYAQNPCPGTPTVEYAGKTYHTVQIGNQCWLKENLDVGKMIKGNQEQSNNRKIEKYCYNDVPSNCNIYGGLYYWNEAMKYDTTPGAQGICPTDWHIPMSEELATLVTAVGNVGNALRFEEAVATNPSGFSALLSGCRYGNARFHYLESRTFFWSSSEYGATDAYHMFLYNGSSMIDQGTFGKVTGFSVRCIQN
jgi:uncharacterized protein (TIGR02145 family)